MIFKIIKISRKVLLFNLVIISSLLLVSCGNSELETISDEPYSITVDDDAYSELGYNLFLKQRFDGKGFNDVELSIINDPSNAFELVKKETTYYIVPIKKGRATLRVEYFEEGRVEEIPISIDWDDELFLESQSRNTITDGAIGFEEGDEIARDYPLSTDFKDVLIYKNGEFIGIIGEIEALGQNLTTTLTMPGEYELKYKNQNEELITFGPLNITHPAFDPVYESPYEYSLNLPNQLSSIEVKHNNEIVNYDRATKFTTIGENNVEVGYQDEVFQTIFTDAFTIRPQFQTSNRVNMDDELIAISQPETIILLNEPEELHINDEAISYPKGDNFEPIEINIRSVGETTLKVIGYETEEPIEYTIDYTNSLQDDIFEYWYVYLGVLIVSGAIIYVKFPKVVK